MNRRKFITESATGVLGSSYLPNVRWVPQEKQGKEQLPNFRIRIVTKGPKHHFFGYYGMSPWNKSETKLICLETEFHDRMPMANETANIGLVQEDGSFQVISKTSAWNLQQGALIHWSPLHPDRDIIFNDRIGDRVQAVSLNTDTGKKLAISRPVNAVAISGKYALGLTFGRLSRLRKVVGYAGAIDPNPDDPHPENDGVFLINLETGQEKLIVSIAQVFEKSVAEYPVLSKRHMWFNHTVINPSGTRFLFLARSKDEKNKLDSAMFTANLDGSDLRQVISFGTGTSHFGWRSDDEIVATFHLNGRKQMDHFIFRDIENPAYKVVGENFILDNGHCTFAPAGNWMATDRKHSDSLSQSLWLFDMELNKGLLLTAKPMFKRQFLHTDTRCDFHPRWNPSGNKICFDAIDPSSWTRQLHVVELF